MELTDIITQMEKGDFTSVTSIDPLLAMQISEEISISRENKARTKLFADVRKLNDMMIGRYFAVDQEDRQKMAEVYQKESHKVIGFHSRKRKGAFEKIGTSQHKIRKMLGKEIDDTSISLLIQISNYSKLIPLLSNYCQRAESLENPTWIDGSIVSYFRLNNLENITRINFAACSKNSEGDWLSSLLYGIPEGLRQRVMNARSLLTQRILVMSSYCEEVGGMERPLITKVGIRKYLAAHDLLPWLCTDFSQGRNCTHQSGLDLIESITFGFPDALKQRVIDVSTMLQHRRAVLEEYCETIESIKKPTKVDASICTFLAQRGLTTWTRYDFVNGKQYHKGSEIDFAESLTFGFPEKLKQRVIDNATLLPHRIRILTEYCEYIESQKRATGKNLGIPKYLKEIGLAAWGAYNFREGETHIWHSGYNQIESLTFGFPEDLKQRVIDANSLTKQREIILRRYCHEAESSNQSSYGLISFLERNKLHSYKGYDYENMGGLKSRSKQEVVRSLTHGIQDQELVAKVRRYALGGK